MKKRVYIPLATQEDNLGDCLINFLLVRELSRTCEVHLDGARSSAAYCSLFEELDINWVNKSNSLYRLSNLLKLRFRGFDVVLTTPGHIGFSGSIRDWIRAVADAVVASGCRVVGTSFWKFGFSVPKLKGGALLGLRFKFCGYERLFVRDSVSWKTLNMANCSLSSDLCFLLPPPPSAGTGERYVACSVRGDKYSKSSLNRYLDQMAELLERRSRLLGCGVLLFYQVQRDFGVVSRLGDLVSARGVPCRLLADRLTMKTFSEIYSTIEEVYTNRLHVVLPALVFGAAGRVVGDPVIDEKIKSLLDDIGGSGVFADLNSDFRQLAPVSVDAVRLASGRDRVMGAIGGI